MEAQWLTEKIWYDDICLFWKEFLLMSALL